MATQVIAKLAGVKKSRMTKKQKTVEMSIYLNPERMKQLSKAKNQLKLGNQDILRQAWLHLANRLSTDASGKVQISHNDIKNIKYEDKQSSVIREKRGERVRVKMYQQDHSLLMELALRLRCNMQYLFVFAFDVYISSVNSPIMKSSRPQSKSARDDACKLVLGKLLHEFVQSEVKRVNDMLVTRYGKSNKTELTDVVFIAEAVRTALEPENKRRY